MKYDDDVWPSVKPHSWKWQTGRVATEGAIIHQTRSGISNRQAALEYQSCLNWFRSPNNLVDHNGIQGGPGTPWYGGMSSAVIGGGRICHAVPPDLVPRFSAGIHDFVALSVEMANGTADTPTSPQDLELLCRWLDSFGVKPHRIDFVDGNNTGWPGIVGHEDTAQGRGSGKSDPGPLFWSQLETFLNGDEVENIERIARLEKLVAGNGIDVTKNGKPARLTGEEALDYADRNGWSAFLGIGQARQATAEHIVNHPGVTGDLILIINGKEVPVKVK